jgi:transcription termination factor Rho
LVKVDKVNGFPPEAIKHRIMFENLTPLHPDKVMTLERDIKSEENLTGRILDIFAPIGKGQRGLIVASPKSGKTVMMQHIAHAITTGLLNQQEAKDVRAAMAKRDAARKAAEAAKQ